MIHTTHPSKQIVRDYMDKRTLADDPPPTPDEVRRQLGWDLIPANHVAPSADDE